MALGASVYKLVFDTAGLENVTASRRELALSKKIMEDTTPAVDKLAQAEANLDRLVSKGLISQTQRSAALSTVKDELMGSEKSVQGLNAAHLNGIPVVGKFSSTLAAVGPIGIAVAASVGGVTIATKLMGAAIDLTVDKIGEQIEKIDKLTEAAETIDIPVGQFQRLSLAAEHADISQDKFAKGTEKMQVNISKGADGSKKLVDAFKLIELDARKLSDMKPDQAFRTITEALDKVPNSADKARASVAIFGSADFLRIDTSQIDRANSLMDQLRGTLDETDASVFDEFDANVIDMNAALDATWQKLAMAVVPALSDAAEVATEWLVKVNQNETFTDTLDEIAMKMEAIVAVASEMPGVLDKWGAAAEGPLGGMLGLKGLPSVAGGVLGVGGAASLGGAMLDPIADAQKRERELDARLDAIKDKAKETAVLDDEVESANEKAIKSADDLTASLQEQAETFGMSARMAALYRSEIENNGRVNVEGRQAAALLDQMEAEKKAQEDAVNAAEKAAKDQEKAQEDAAKKAEAAEKRRQDAIKGTTDKLDDQLRKLQLSEREQLVHALTVEQASQMEIDAALEKFDKIEELENRQRALQTATARAGAIKAGSWEAAEAFASASQKKLLGEFFAPNAPGNAAAPNQAASRQAMIAPQAKEQLAEAKKSNSLLNQIVEKLVPITVEEVTL